MKVLLNGGHEELEQGISVDGLLIKHGIDKKLVAVEHNGRLLEKDEYGLILEDGDRLEVVRFVGGG